MVSAPQELSGRCDSGNRTCGSPASGSRTRPHAFVHGTSCMRRFVLGWKMFGLERSLGTRLITYADEDLDFEGGPTRDSCRQSRLRVLAQARAAQSFPWDARRTLYWRTRLSADDNWLP